MLKREGGGNHYRVYVASAELQPREELFIQIMLWRKSSVDTHTYNIDQYLPRRKKTPILCVPQLEV